MSNKFNRIIYTINFSFSIIAMCLIDYTSIQDFISSILLFIIFFVSFMSFMFTFENRLYFVRTKNIKKALAKSIKVKDKDEIILSFKNVNISDYSPKIVKIFYNDDSTKRVVISENNLGNGSTNYNIQAYKLNFIDKDEYFTFMDYAFWDFDYSFSSGDYYADVESILNDCEHLLKEYHEEEVPKDISNTFISNVKIKWKTRRLKKELPFGSNYHVTIMLNHNKIEGTLFVTSWYSLYESIGRLYLQNVRLNRNTKFSIIENNKIIAKGKVTF